jgi:hypothetical protein
MTGTGRRAIRGCHCAGVYRAIIPQTSLFAELRPPVFLRQFLRPSLRSAVTAAGSEAKKLQQHFDDCGSHRWRKPVTVNESIFANPALVVDAPVAGRVSCTVA